MDVVAKAYSPQSRVLTVDGRDIVIPKANSAPAVRTWAWRSRAGTLVGAINYDKTNTHQVRITGAARSKALMGPAPAADGEDAVLTIDPYSAAAVAW